MKTKHIAAVAVLATSLLSGCGGNYSNGSRVGVVTKLSERGLLFNSWEGEMNMGGVREERIKGRAVSVPNAFTFNVDPAALPKVKAALTSGARVELIYREWFLAPPTIDNRHVVIDVKPAN